MRSNTLTYRLLFLLLLFGGQPFRAEAQPGAIHGERVQVVTDRNLYVAGETIFFSALILADGDDPSEKFSHVLYGELIKPDGGKIVSRKYRMVDFSGDGCLAIPDETLTGIYYLKFYTRYMRNFNPESYQYIPVTIVNPDKPETLPVRTGEEPFRQKLALNPLPENGQFRIISDGKDHYAPREEVVVRIQVNTSEPGTGHTSLSVVPQNTDNDVVFDMDVHKNSNKSVEYIPETRGVTLTGQFRDKTTGKPLAGVRVNLSIIGERDIQVVRTDSLGRFFFALPDKTGNNDIFLCGEEIPGTIPEILIDNDFCTRSVSLPSPRFTLTMAQKETALQLAVNQRISRIYQSDTVPKAPDSVPPTASFYGKPDEVLYLDRYIEMPTLKEYFTELPVLVKLRKVEGERRFTFYTNDPEMFMYKPLVLVDWVAVENMEKILAMTPTEIDRVELVNAPYLKGDIMYGGIVSFISKRSDFAGIDLPTSGTFVNYQFLSDCSADTRQQPVTSTKPDARNTVTWVPHLAPGPDGTASVTFMAPDTPGKYVIKLRIISKTGEVSAVSQSFTVQ